MIKLEIKSAWSPDLPSDSMTFDFTKDTGYEPEMSNSVGFLVCLDIGPEQDDWSEHFELFVTTSNIRRSHEHRLRSMQVHNYSFRTLKAYLISALAACERTSWDESLIELRKRFYWEFEPRGS